eukprot:TRINITY_DN1361_c0_g1_i1.p1 TRINITY_DN1361_c0_g1~~TRINITY_DN1361_c0_g1_i1.p1  ORF type:complete len:169 (-),score=72.82 TRINITY_DN1361_c0_g1_i1:56-499(-)
MCIRDRYQRRVHGDINNMTAHLQKAVFEKMKDVEPMKHYNLKVKIVKVENVVKIKRIDDSPVDMAVCLVGDETGCAKLLLKNAQVQFAKENSSIILRNAMARIVKEKVRFEVDIWGKVEKCDEVFKEINLKNNISEAEYEAVPAKQY